jgi:UDP-N-acetylmuramoylalanine--D-glutamate ligase
MTGLGDILILGLGESGMAAARHTAGLVGAREASSVTLVDSGASDAHRARAAELRALGVNVLLDVDAVVGRFDLAIASPGIPPHAPLFVSAAASSTRIVSEIEFAFSRSTHTWVAVTGTNGKTTTTSLIVHLLQAAGIPARAVGNIGHVALSAVSEADETEVLVAEVSSFQLANVDTFRPLVAVLLNVTPDHLNWHGSFDEYSWAKARVFENLGESDTAVIDVDDPGSAPFAGLVEERGVGVIRVSRLQGHAGGATVVDGALTLETRGGAIRLISEDELLIRGAHNVSNALAAAATAHVLGASAKDIQRGLRSFEPIEHRLEPVAEVAGVGWFNDSKATNPDAVFKALTAFGNRPLVLLLGGRNKGSDMRPLAVAVAARAKAAVVFGEAATEIAAAFEGLDIELVRTADLSDAVVAAAAIALEGDAVVLSPACASFDEFDSYEHRGRTFKSLVLDLAEGGAE